MARIEMSENTDQNQKRVPLLERTFSRRQVLEGAAAVGTGAVAWAMVGCGEDADESNPSVTGTETSTLEPTPTETPFSPLLESDPMLQEFSEVIEGKMWYAKGVMPEWAKKPIADAREGVSGVVGKHDGTIFINIDGKVFPIIAFNGLWRATGVGGGVESISIEELNGEQLKLVGNSDIFYDLPENSKKVREVNPAIGDDVAHSEAPSVSQILTLLADQEGDKKGQQVSEMLLYKKGRTESSTADMPFGQPDFSFSEFNNNHNIPAGIANNTERGSTGQAVTKAVWTRFLEEGVPKDAIIQAFENGIFAFDHETSEVKIQTSGDLAVKIIVPGIAADMTAEQRKPQEDEPLNSGLKEYASKLGIKMGVLIEPTNNNSRLRDIYKNDFNLGVLTFAMNDHVRKPGEYDFGWTGARSNQAGGLEMSKRLHALLFPSQYAEWFKSLSGSELEEAMQQYIHEVCSRFEGVDEIVVVNEPGIDPYRPDDHLRNQFGYDYIVKAFRTARNVTSAKLIYNDTYNHSSEPGQNGITTVLSHQIVDRLKQEGLIDKLGVQMHLHADSPPSRDDISRTLQSYGIPVDITEFDVDMSGIAGTQKERNELQAKIVSDAMNGVLDSGVCESITVWGVGDKLSWYEKFLKKEDADPTLFDDNLEPKPSYYALLDVLKSRS